MVLALAGAAPAVIVAEDAPNFEKVSWYKDPGLRKLYFYAFILCIASATTGYDGYAPILTSGHELHNVTNSAQIVLERCPGLSTMGFIFWRPPGLPTRSPRRVISDR